ALVVMMTGDAVVYYPAQSSSALVIYERGHVSAGEMLKFGLWMTLVGWIAILLVALPWWSLVGQPLPPHQAEAASTFHREAPKPTRFERGLRPRNRILGEARRGPPSMKSTPKACDDRRKGGDSPPPS